MKYAISCLLTSLLIGIIFADSKFLVVSESGINILFTVTGIIFSVGMSLLVTSSTQNIHNSEEKKKIQRVKMRTVKGYIWNFAVLCIVYAIINGFTYFEGKDIISLYDDIIRFNPSLFVIMMTLLCNIYLISNFISIMILNNKIEKVVDEELEDHQ